ncbi:uncharacterized protein LOC129831578 [Salvelinus fontinalis]|uniref:uncharacterized protein LOC129831578 n=1 Tax=Salvelinus fontinalis TaxID=8038 RepID=UPI002484E12C|nr:uncharacterized protein LOC129831578 [Salvelinus fontinalis]
MVSAGFQMLGTALGIIGWIGAIVVCALPQWKVTAFIGENIITAQTTWQGIWMNCVVQSTGQMQCKVYDSMLALPQDLQAARALIIISIMMGLVGILLAVAGGKCTNCVEDERAKSRIGVGSGVVFIIAGVLCLIPVCWSANTIIRDFYNPMLTSSRLTVIIVCALPMWKVTAFIGANIVTAQTIWEGMWMTCVVQSTGQMQCKVYDSILALPQDLQAARAMIIISILTGIVGICLSIAGGKCTNCTSDSSKSKVTILGGILLLICAVLVLFPVCWSAAFTISDFNNPLTIETQRREIGASIYIGWGSTALLLIGGFILCTSCPPQKMYGYPSYSQGAPMYPYPCQPMVQAGPYGRVYTPTSRPYSGTGSYAPTSLILQQKQEVFQMVSMGSQMLGFALAIIGFLGTIIVCALPMWKVTAFIGANIVTAQVIWEGLWMNCVTQSTGQMQCKIYDSLLALPQDLQAARALSVIAIIASCFGILLGIAGGKCTNFVEDEASKAKVAIASGIIFIVAGVLILVPVCWSANTIVRDFYNPLLVEAQRRELGASLYIGWGTAGLLILGGGLLCSSCPPKEERDDYPVKYSQARSTATSRAYV